MSKRKQHCNKQCPRSGANPPIQNMAQVFGGTLGDAGFQWTFEYCRSRWPSTITTRPSRRLAVGLGYVERDVIAVPADLGEARTSAQAGAKIGADSMERILP